MKLLTTSRALLLKVQVGGALKFLVFCRAPCYPEGGQCPPESLRSAASEGELQQEVEKQRETHGKGEGELIRRGPCSQTSRSLPSARLLERWLPGILSAPAISGLLSGPLLPPVLPFQLPFL